ncbi:hypothetical protein GO755_34550 [Spirosoma sp. HMF4905]|uniref:Uncharacterized protein n=1 Tax=Spirosoma arboris TaxID=2682092 RepID=A0A7K1SNM9_9BACT|nr:hypothetical protein [Spirosoma arboris]MVM35196.1 hypothetical protein [Spirosoma arboris]
MPIFSSERLICFYLPVREKESFRGLTVATLQEESVGLMAQSDREVLI